MILSIIFRMQIYRLLLLKILDHEHYTVLFCFVCVCVCVCVMYSCIQLSLFTFFMSLSFERQIGFRIYSNLHGLVCGTFQSYLPLSEYCYYNVLSFKSFLYVFFQDIFSDLLTLFFPAFLSITIPIGCLFLIINVSNVLGQYNQVSSVCIHE